MKIFATAIRWCAGCALAVVIGQFAAPALGQQAAGTGAFPKTDQIEKQLRRGVSTRTDVRRLLGVPNGSGGALLPGYGENSEQLDSYQIWFYQDVEISNFKSEGDRVKMDMRQQILAVFFKGDVFYGYFWTSSEGAGASAR